MGPRQATWVFGSPWARRSELLKIATSQNAVGSQEFGDITIPEGTRFTITVTLRLSGFNEPVEIEAPSEALGGGIPFPPNPPSLTKEHALLPR